MSGKAEWHFPMCFRSIRRCESGVEAIEFAMVSPIVLLLILGTVELGFAFAAQHLMESGMYDASRLGRTGHIAEDTTQEETIIATLGNRAGLMLDMDNVVLTSIAYDEFTEIGLPEPFTDANGNGIRDDGENYEDLNGNGEWDEDRGVVGYGAASQIVVYTATYPWPLHTPILSQALGSDGFLNLSAHAVVKNEPY